MHAWVTPSAIDKRQGPHSRQQQHEQQERAAPGENESKGARHLVLLVVLLLLLFFEFQSAYMWTFMCEFWMLNFFEEPKPPAPYVHVVFFFCRFHVHVVRWG